MDIIWMVLIPLIVIGYLFIGAFCWAALYYFDVVKSSPTLFLFLWPILILAIIGRSILLGHGVRKERRKQLSVDPPRVWTK